MNQKLVKAIANLALFLEFSSDEIIDPDAATEAMEQLSSTLQAMSLGDQLEFADIARRLALDCTNTQERAFLTELPAALGLPIRE